MADKFRFDPLADLHNYREAVRRTLESGWALPRDLMPSPLNAVVIPVDVLDNGTEIVIKAGLPGVLPEDVSISVLEDKLTIKAQAADDEDIKGAVYLSRERKATTFYRTLTLPMPVEARRAEASFKNGVLTLTLPKSERIRPRVIKAVSE